MEYVTKAGSESDTQTEEVSNEKKWDSLLSGATLRLRAQRTKSYLQEQFYLFRREMDWFSSIQLTAVLVLFAIFLLAPIGMIMLSAFSFEGVPSLFWIQEVFSQSIYWPMTQVFPGLVPLADAIDQLRNPLTAPNGWAALQAIMASDVVPLHTHPIGWLFEVRGRFIDYSAAANTLVIQGVDAGAIVNSLYAGLLTTLFSTAIGVTLAFIMARYEFRGKTILRVLLLVPLLAIPFVGAVGLLRMISIDGTINVLFYEILHILPYRIVLDGLAAVVLVQTLHFFSLTYLSSYAAFQNIDPTLEESAENMGAKGFTLFRKVTLPLALPGIEAGAILTFILSVEDLGTLIVFEDSTQVKHTLTYAIFNNIWAPTGTVEGIATALGVILLIIAMISFFFIRRYMSLRHYAMMSKGGTWNPRFTVGKWFHYIIFYGFIIGILAVALLPHLGVFLLAFMAPGSWGTGDLIPTAFWAGNFLRMFVDPEFFGSIVNSLVYSTIAVIIIILVGTGAAYIIARKKIPGREWLDLLVTIPIALPGIVIAIGYLIFFSNAPFFNLFLSPVLFYAPISLITFSYTVRKFPFTVRSTYAGLQQTHVELEEAAQNLGASRIRVFAGIVLPIIGASILAGAMMSFVYCMSEVSTSIVLGDINSQWGPITWKMQSVLGALAMGQSMAAAMGVLLMVIQIIVMTIVNVVLKRRSEALIGI